MKMEEIKGKTESELADMLFEVQLQQTKSRAERRIAQHAFNPGKIREAKKTIARIKTELRSRKLKVE